ncbi:MAG: bifunctional 2-C-methyl-D-erythritol 4-phosphate cytidylyltransferase/2-C-methyl-D-erythritol 2,4-cyclodiphosphate synthase [Rubricella sp.]
MRATALIVAAGRGTRAGSPLPKQFVKLGGEPILTRTMRALLASSKIGAVRVVIHADDEALYRSAIAELDDHRIGHPVIGGASRAASVRNGLEALATDPPDAVLIHDAARPFLSKETVTALLDALEKAPGACPALPIVDALWVGDASLDTARPREGLLRAQTPQAFRFDAILAAHREHPEDWPDDVAAARAAGLAVAAVPGDERNFKITTPGDFARAEREVAMTAPGDVRVGNGFDVHAFEPGDHVTLCGIDIPHDKALKGHSDADVGLHTITDALFGAIAEGDIGQWFPPSEPQWKGMASHVFLEKAVERVAARGGRITAIDCTLICERPKIGPHCEAMRTRVAEICGIDASRVSIKATTSERLGFTGREEGIAAMATATVVLS